MELNLCCASLLFKKCKKYLLENFINPLTNDPGISADDAKKSYRHLYGRQFDNWLHRIQQIQDIISEKLSQPAQSRPHAHKPTPAQPQTHDSKATVSRKAEEIIKWLDADFIENNFLSDAGWRRHKMILAIGGFESTISDFIIKLENALEAAEKDGDRGFLDRHKDKLNKCKTCLEGITNILALPKETLENKYDIDMDDPRSNAQTWASSIASINEKIAEKPSAQPPYPRRQT